MNSWTYGAPIVALHGDLTDPNMNTALNTSPTARYFCSLTRITGILNNNGGWIATYNQPVSNGWQWYVSGKKNSVPSILPYLPPTTYPLSGAARFVQ